MPPVEQWLHQPQAPPSLVGSIAGWLPRLAGCRQVEPPRARKSIGAEVNWGVRFTSEEDAHRFLRKIGAHLPACLPAFVCSPTRLPPCPPVFLPLYAVVLLLPLTVLLPQAQQRLAAALDSASARLPACPAATDLQQRMQQAGVKGRSVTLKIMRRKEVRSAASAVASAATCSLLLSMWPPRAWWLNLSNAALLLQGAPEPIKFLGHGHCDNLSRSGTAGTAGAAGAACQPDRALTRDCGVCVLSPVPTPMRKGPPLAHLPALHYPPAVRLARFTASAEDIAGECRTLLRALRVPFGDIRGMGITVGRWKAMAEWPALALLLVLLSGPAAGG